MAKYSEGRLANFIKKKKTNEYAGVLYADFTSVAVSHKIKETTSALLT